MVDEPDIERLARTFLDLWQEQVAASASDAGLAGLFAGGKAEDQAGDHANNGSDGAPPAPPGATAAGFSPGLGDDQLAEFARRLADCAQRLAALERGAKRQGS
jgi:hypothetical protein